MDIETMIAERNSYLDTALESLDTVYGTIKPQDMVRQNDVTYKIMTLTRRGWVGMSVNTSLTTFFPWRWTIRGTRYAINVPYPLNYAKEAP